MTDHDRIEGTTDEELARRARAGSVRSFEELARRYKRRLFVYLRPRVGSDEDAEDLVQETFLKLYRNIGSYDPEFRFSTWLYTSAGRLAIDAYRKGVASKDKLAGESVAELPDPAADRDRDPRLSGLWAAARGLGGDRFRVLWLRYGEDLTIEEIAAVLGRTKLAVRILLHRARTSLMSVAGPSPARTIVPAKAADVRGARL
ncbi:MAG: sigma-70 family RNA polymerase sigma factor [Candidatus Aminicenantes bacterium]|nr:sigma-70 family RNA polymerase sigma factor [Candidatus Aminicenantes bacterium]